MRHAWLLLLLLLHHRLLLLLLRCHRAHLRRHRPHDMLESVWPGLHVHELRLLRLLLLLLRAALRQWRLLRLRRRRLRPHLPILVWRA